MKELTRQLSSFVGVGAAATALHYFVLVVLVEGLSAAPPRASFAGALAGAALSYALNRRHTFRSDAPHRRALWRFAAVALAAAAFNYGLMRLFVDAMGAPYLPAQVVTTGVLTLWTFLAHRVFTFS